jgi:hypothetical protein
VIGCSSFESNRLICCVVPSALQVLGFSMDYSVAVGISKFLFEGIVIMLFAGKRA